MNKLILNIIILFIAFAWTQPMLGQGKKPFYKIEDGNICFEFDIREMEEMIENEASKFHDFSDFDIRNLITTSTFTDWNQDGWKILKVNRYVYQLIKKIDDFTDQLSFQSKYLINSSYWTRPLSQSPDYFGADIKSKIGVSEDGNISFHLDGYEDKDNVILTGSFNDWDEYAIGMNKSDDGWTINMQMPPGIYEYKFIADGNWTHDTAQELTVENQFGTLNSILLVGNQERFYLIGHNEATKVVVAGSFNSWNEEDMTMHKTDFGWELTTPLPPGKHFYKFKVDSEWMTDPVNDLQERDRNGYSNSVKLIH